MKGKQIQHAVVLLLKNTQEPSPVPSSYIHGNLTGSSLLWGSDVHVFIDAKSIFPFSTCAGGQVFLV